MFEMKLSVKALISNRLIPYKNPLYKGGFFMASARTKPSLEANLLVHFHYDFVLSFVISELFISLVNF